MRKLIFALTLSIILTPLALAAFDDVSVSHKNRTAIDYLHDEGVIGGYQDGTYRPESSINRAEMMKMLVEGLGITPDSNRYRNCFPDVGSEWFARYVCYAKEKDWVGGYPDGKFRPANNVLDVEAFKMILNARGVELEEDFVPLLFNGISPNEWYRPYLLTAERLNLTDYFKPGASYKRGQVAEVIFRTIVIDEMEVSSFSDQAQSDLLNLKAQEELGNQQHGPAAYESYTSAKREAYEGSKPFAIFFHASWCSVCNAIDEDFTENLPAYPDGVTILKADYDKETSLKSEFGVTRQYWFVIFDKEGDIVFSNNLFGASEVIAEISKTL